MVLRSISDRPVDAGALTAFRAGPALTCVGRTLSFAPRLPSHRGAIPETRCYDAAEEASSPRRHDVATYLLTWNPAKWKWRSLAADARKLRSGKQVRGRGICGVFKVIRPGDRLFLLK